MIPQTSRTVAHREPGIASTRVTNELADVVNALTSRAPGTGYGQDVWVPSLLLVKQAEADATRSNLFNAKTLIGDVSGISDVAFKEEQLGEVNELNDVLALDLNDFPNLRLSYIVCEDKEKGKIVVALFPNFGIEMRITSKVQDGSNKRWIYQVQEIEKLAEGIDGWSVKTGGRTGTAYNRAEEMNGTTVPYGNGITTAIPAGFDLMPIPVDRMVVCQPKSITKSDGVVEVEYWFSADNAVDGSCS